MGSTLRKTDEKCADIVTAFLEDFFYSKTENYQKITNRKEQVQGIDSKFTLDGVDYLCDEKAAIRYVNRPLHTFALELSFKNRVGEIHDGWLIDEFKVNNSFLFVWIDKAKHDILESIDDIEYVEIALVSREKIFQYLETIGWSRDNLMSKCDKIRYEEDTNFGFLGKNGCKFSFSTQLYEEPINILLTREKLIEISDKTMIYEASN